MTARRRPTAWSHALSLLMPITMVVVIPGWLLQGRAHAAGWPLATVGLILFVAAASLFLTTEYLFIAVGRGTLAPWDQTQELVLSGPYRHCRNPMISAVLGMILAEVLFFASWPLLTWAAVFFVVNTAYFRLSEEPGLERRFGASYREYRSAVPRWVPRPTPYRADQSSQPQGRARTARLALVAALANEAMRKAWDGPEGAQWSELAEGFERASMQHRTVLLSAAALSQGEEVLDLGCGNGALTLQAGAAVAPGRVVGIDLSSAMLANGRARAAAAGRGNVSFVHADAQVYAFEPASFDVVVSNAGAMFFDDQDAAFANLRTALKPGGRIALLVWQPIENNEWLLELRRALALGRDLPTPPVGTPGPFGLADPDRTRELLARTGYSSIRIEDVRPPMRVGDDVESAYAFVSRMGNTRGLLDGLGEDDRIAALDNLRIVLAEHATPQGVVFGTASWLVTATR